MPEHTPAPTSSRAVYGFALMLNMQMLFFVYIIWAVVPPEWFEELEISCLPQRYWAVSVPIFLLTVFACAFLIYFSLGLLMTPSWADMRCIRDSYSVKLDNIQPISKTATDICNCKFQSKCKASTFQVKMINGVQQSHIPVLQELDIVVVSAHLHANI